MAKLWTKDATLCEKEVSHVIRDRRFSIRFFRFFIEKSLSVTTFCLLLKIKSHLLTRKSNLFTKGLHPLIRDLFFLTKEEALSEKELPLVIKDLLSLITSFVYFPGNRATVKK